MRRKISLHQAATTTRFRGHDWLVIVSWSCIVGGLGPFGMGSPELKAMHAYNSRSADQTLFISLTCICSPLILQSSPRGGGKSKFRCSTEAQKYQYQINLNQHLNISCRAVRILWWCFSRPEFTPTHLLSIIPFPSSTIFSLGGFFLLLGAGPSNWPRRRGGHELVMHIHTILW
jgi:hypothetical protein